MKEVFAGVQQIRPGRNLFVRQWILGCTNDDGDDDDDDSDLQQFVFVHGSCASESDFHPCLQALDEELLLLSSLRNNNNNKLDDSIATTAAAASSSRRRNMRIRIRCVLFDQMGCGQSPPVASLDQHHHCQQQQDYSRDAQVQDLNVILHNPNLVNPNIPVVFVGHSYGPSIFLSWLLSSQNNDSKKNKNKNNNGITTTSTDDDDDDDDKMITAANTNTLPIIMIRGLVFLASSLRDEGLPYPDGGHYIFRLPLFVLKWLQHSMSVAFCDAAISSSSSNNNSSSNEVASGDDDDEDDDSSAIDKDALRKMCIEKCDANDMFMVKSFYQQTIWATRDDLTKAISTIQSAAAAKETSSMKKATATASPSPPPSCLILHGKDDKVIAPQQGRQIANHIQQTFPNSFCEMQILKDAGHLLMLERPRAVARAIVQYLITSSSNS